MENLVNVSMCKKCIYIPNAFSPNDDNVNDYFEIYNSCPLAYSSIAVFNRWGEKVFATTDLHWKWDGKYKNEKLDSQVLVYYLFTTYSNGTVEHYQGSLTLIR